MKVFRIITLLSSLLYGTLFAQMQDQWGLSMGGMFVINFDTDMQIGKKGVPLGAKINTKDQLGLNSEPAVFRADGFYRFSDAHSIALSYYAVRSTGDRFVENEFEWNGDVLSDVQTNSHFNMDVYKVNYGYSFYHNTDVELMLTAGLHITTLEAGLNASGKVNDVPNEYISSKGQITAPLPVFGFEGEYTIITDTLFVNYKSEYFFIEFENYRGAFVSSMLTMDYFFLDHIGIGAGLNTNKIMAEMDNGDTKVNIENNLNGIYAYLKFVY